VVGAAIATTIRNGPGTSRGAGAKTLRYIVTSRCSANGPPLTGSGNASHGNLANPAASAVTRTPIRTGIDVASARRITSASACRTGPGEKDSASNSPTRRIDDCTLVNSGTIRSRVGAARARARRTSSTAPTRPGRTPP
jgi:hypothetical protein